MKARIYSQKEYDMLGNCKTRENALSQALRTREFEIELY